ncbi:hypothetical protein [Roseicitreum antarcticum]|nr:hypothetical protein [Roseicitreum antarcticum]
MRDHPPTHMQSRGYTPGPYGGGWAIDPDGSAEFGTLSLRDSAADHSAVARQAEDFSNPFADTDLRQQAEREAEAIQRAIVRLRFIALFLIAALALWLVFLPWSAAALGQTISNYQTPNAGVPW